MEDNSLEDLKATAYHEAGHAAAYFYFGERLKRITIIPTEDYMGCCFDYHKGPREDFIIGTPSPKKIKKTERKFIIELAGCLAEDKYLGREYSLWPDAQNMMTLYERKFSEVSVEEADAYIGKFYMDASDMINQEHIWAFIEALAVSLLEKKMVKGKEAKAIWDKVLKEYSLKAAKIVKKVIQLYDELDEPGEVDLFEQEELKKAKLEIAQEYDSVRL